MTYNNQYDLEHPLLVAKFEKIGLAREDVKGLPEDVKATLSSGGLSPLILLNIKQGQNEYLMPAKLRLGINEITAQQELFVHGVNNSFQNTLQLDKNEIEALKKGLLVIITEKNESVFVQLDPETKNLLKAPAKDLKLDEKLNSIEKIHDIELGKEQKERIKEGKPVTLNVGGEDITIGIDLRSPNAFKQLQGDMNEWKRQKEIEYDIAHPEYLGLVKTDQNRWEYHMIQTKGLEANKEIKAAPAQVKSSGMKL